MSDYGGTFEEDFFPNTKIEHLELDILSDAWQDLQAEITANGWAGEEGLRFILAAGLAAVRAERQREAIRSMPEADLRDELDRLQRQRLLIDGRHAVMKFRAYQFFQDARTLNWMLDICKQKLESLTQINRQLRLTLESQSAQPPNDR